MSHETDAVAARVRGIGVALADYDVAIFNLSFSADGKTAADAKDALKERVTKFNDALDKLTVAGLVVTKDTLKTNATVRQNWTFNHKKNKNEAAGFTAYYTVTFHTTNVDLVSKVYDTLSSLDHIELSAPQFKLSNLDSLHRDALKDAFVKADERFKMECGVLSLDTSNFKIHSWNVHYSENELAARAPSRSAMGGARAQAYESASLPDDSLELVAGKATVLVTLDVSYCRK